MVIRYLYTHTRNVGLAVSHIWLPLYYKCPWAKIIFYYCCNYYCIANRDDCCYCIHMRCKISSYVRLYSVVLLVIRFISLQSFYVCICTYAFYSTCIKLLQSLFSLRRCNIHENVLLNIVPLFVGG